MLKMKIFFVIEIYNVHFKMSLPWSEKYRPKNINDVKNQDNIVKMIQFGIKSGNLPHLLLHGSPGTGKTSTALAICNEIYKSHENIRRNVLELNASDERGIDVVRSKIKTFSQTTVFGFPFKVIILDEVDTMTNDAQSALRRIMETFSETTRFFLMCNYLTKVIYPIVSRCAKYRFSSIETESIENILRNIFKCENVSVSDNIIKEISILSDGDLRKSINTAHLVSVIDVRSTSEIADLMGCIPESYVESMWCKIKNTDCVSQNDLVDETYKTLRDGYSIRFYIEKLANIVVLDESLPSSARENICKLLSQVESRLVMGSSHEVQFLGLILECRSMI